ncbi:MAG TPA: tyrosine-type recombinase/integrase [Polyangiaceae bacterium]|nr:tyrosine-type recombinase/integrase [Polyangiaceae bacterium]
MPKPTKLTAKVLSALRPGERIRDTVVRGLFAERGVRGVSLKVQADLRLPGQPVQTVKQTLGHFGPELSLDTARARAQGLLSTIKSRVDPRAPAADPAKLTVRAMFEAYGQDLRTRGCTERSIADHADKLTRYLPALAERAVADVKPSDLRAEHARVTLEHGKVAANKAMRAYRSAFNVALLHSDDPDALGGNPVRAIRFHPERRKEAVILPTDLRDWYERLQKIPNPLRRIMHELGLLSGLRPGVLMALEKSWVDLERRAISIPHERQKSRRDFALPLSEHMIGLVRRALVLSNEVASGSPWLFPTRTADGSEVIATRVVRERTMPSETGHILRHTHATLAKAAGVDDMLASLLSDHKVAGIRGVYVHEKALFEQLLAAQERVSAHILGLLAFIA